MEEKLLEAGFRKKIIQEIKASEESKERMQESLREVDIYNSNIRPYVRKKLEDRFPPEVVDQLPIVASVNILKKTADAKANLYKNEPVRTFTDLDDNQKDSVSLIYRDGRINSEMLWSNKFYEIQRQNHVKIVPKNGRLEFRTLKNHQLNVIPYPDNPEKGYIYIISSFDKFTSDLKEIQSDGQNQKIADRDDYKPETERFVIWSPNYHFVMNGLGEITSEEIENPIAPVVPIVEIASPNKDFEYWLRGFSEIAEFTVDYNEQLSMVNQIVELQGFSQAYYKAPKDLQPATLSIGPHRILRLTTDPDNPQSDIEFGFANPSSDIASSQDFVQSMLSQFLSSQGLDPSLVTSNAQASQSFSSGVERLLAMVDKFEASKDTQDIFRDAEAKIYQVVKAWLNTLRDSDMLDDKYKTSEISESSELVVNFARPETIQTPDEKLSLIERKLELGLMTKVDALMELRGIDKEEAEEILRMIDGENQGIEA